ncbi:MAG: molybdopterin-binding protein, partial [Firmicutes bacterium]|nr:molybdopterin-binding protein [Bacillota bacterium]
MKLIRTEDAVGSVLCHDMTQIIPGVTKDARFRKGHIVTEEDIPVLLSMGKENLYVFELPEGFLHEDEAAERLVAMCLGPHMTRGQAKEGKIEIKADADGLFKVDRRRLALVNGQDQLMIATRMGNVAVKKGDKLAGMRVIPLVIEAEKLEKAAELVGTEPLLQVEPFTVKTAAVIVTGSEVAKGLIEDQFGPVVEKKLADFGVETIYRTKCVDDTQVICDALAEARASGAEAIFCT